MYDEYLILTNFRVYLISRNQQTIREALFSRFQKKILALFSRFFSTSRKLVLAKISENKVVRKLSQPAAEPVSYFY